MKNEKKLKQEKIRMSDEEMTLMTDEEMQKADEFDSLEAETPEISKEVKETDVSNHQETSQNPPKVKMIAELRSKRTENCRVFRLSDGTEQAEFFTEPIFAFDNETGEYVDIDNDMIEEEDGRHFRNKINNFIAKFSREETNDELFSIEKDQYKLIFSAKKNARTKNRGILPKMIKRMMAATTTQETTTESATSLPGTDTVVFESVRPESDFEYSVTNTGVKENIVIKSKMDAYRYSFDVVSENLEMVVSDEEKTIHFHSKETGEEIFYIPAPFMTDAAGEESDSVYYDAVDDGNGHFSISVIADSSWINNEDRVFPITVDPQVKITYSDIITYGYTDNNGTKTIAQGTTNKIGFDTTSYYRMYMKINKPTLPNNAFVKKVELKLHQVDFNKSNYATSTFSVHHVTQNISTGSVIPAHNTDCYDIHAFTDGKLDTDTWQAPVYNIDLTKMYRSISENVCNIVIKLKNEISVGTGSQLYGTFGSHTYIPSAFRPSVTITYDSQYKVEDSNETLNHNLGRFGTGRVNLINGNLMFESEDFAVGGLKLPLTVKHLYNSALANHKYTTNTGIGLNVADFGGTNLGYGWKLNIMQSMYELSYNSCVYVNETGEEIYFKPSNHYVDDQCGEAHALLEDESGWGYVYNPLTKVMTIDEKHYQFDSAGRLISITNEHNVSQRFNYSSTGRLMSAVDGAGRIFRFNYSALGYLTSIESPVGKVDNPNDTVKIFYEYTGARLSKITYPNGRSACISYDATGKPASVTLCSDDGCCLKKMEYTYNGYKTTYLTEYGSNNAKNSMKRISYEYSVNSTSVFHYHYDNGSPSCYKITHVFDNEGKITGNYCHDLTNDHFYLITGNYEDINNGTVAVEPVSNNLLLNHCFEKGSLANGTIDHWSKLPECCNSLAIRSAPHYNKTTFGVREMRMDNSSASDCEAGVYQTVANLPAGDYTFSTYMRLYKSVNNSDNLSCYIKVTDTSGALLARSETIKKDYRDVTRLTASFKLAAAKSVNVCICMIGKGCVIADAAQLESNPYATAYNLLTNGSFNYDWSNGWSGSGKIVTSPKFNGSNTLRLGSGLTVQSYQDVAVVPDRDKRETFTLSAWAKATSAPTDREGSHVPSFAIRAKIYYNAKNSDNTTITEEYSANFNPAIEAWQHASVTFSKKRYYRIQRCEIILDYSYNNGEAFFGGIQLLRDNLETDLSESDFTGISDSTAVTSADTDAVQEEAPETEQDEFAFTEFHDQFGNPLTSTTFQKGKFGALYCAYKYNDGDCCNNTAADAGNDVVEETDSRGNKTTYIVDPDSSRVDAIIDRCGNQTAYTFDDSGRTTVVTNKDRENNEIATVAYTYDPFDNLTGIARGDGQKYDIGYNEAQLLKNISVRTGASVQDLVNYTYKNSSGRLKTINYANGWKMTATYNSLGRMTHETWYLNDVEKARYIYAYNGAGNIVRSIDKYAKKEYNYVYEGGKITHSTEYSVSLNGNEIVTEKILLNTVRYFYTKEEQLERKLIEDCDGNSFEYHYEYPENGEPIVCYKVNGQIIRTQSESDHLGRKVFDELQLGKANLFRKFSYTDGAATQKHLDEGAVLSKPTTTLVSKIEYADGRTIEYEYDEEERITKVIDSFDGITEYEYDALGQLKTETVNGTVVNNMTYDNYGNITEKNGVVYQYGNAVWKDLLTQVGTGANSTITYDANGNPTTYLGHTLAWEKGRQLKKFGNHTYTYNASGIRTSKTVNGITHTYTLDGPKILKEIWGTNSLMPLYDNFDQVCGLVYNDLTYYFNKNLQGDIIGITDKNANTVARYTYNAWGQIVSTQDADGNAIIDPSHIANINPYRYRGYYFDTEIQMYYLQSRYYNPEIGRFLNSDDATFAGIHTTTLSCNLIAYCNNSPVINTDLTGCDTTVVEQFSQWAPLLGSVVPALAAYKAAIIAAVKSVLGFLWNIFVVVGLVIVLLILINAIATTAQRVMDRVREEIEGQKANGKKEQNSPYVVYVLTRDGNTDTIFYVGRTKNYSARMNAHSRKQPFSSYIVFSCLTYVMSRVIEQAVLSACIASMLITIGVKGSRMNQIRGIAKDKLKGFRSTGGADSPIKRLASLITCTTESDMYNLMGI